MRARVGVCYTNELKNECRKMIAQDIGPKILTSRVICADNRGPKVLLCEDGEIIKYFKAGRYLSHRGYLKRAVQFERNGAMLRKLGFRTPTEIQVIDGMRGVDTAVRYRPVEGEDVKALIFAGEEAQALCSILGDAFRKLHDQGVVFKANHMSNFIYKPGEPMGLIDFDNLYKLPFGLPTRVRKGNILRLARFDPTLIDVDAFFCGYRGQSATTQVQTVEAQVRAELGS